MRTLALLGMVLFTGGIFLLTRAADWHFGYLYMIGGSVAGLLGLLILGLSTGEESPAPAPRRPRAKGRLRSRSTTGIRSLRVRRAPVGAGGGK